jgi:hypothetical protein
VGDTARMRRAAQGAFSALSGVDPRSDDASYAALIRHDALTALSEVGLLDSLRRSTAAYVALQRANWAKASGERPEALQFPIGRTAAPIQGDFWYGRADSATPRPTRGRVALVVFVDHPTCSGSAVCWSMYARLHRLAERFPRLEVTLVANTRGYVAQMAPPPPQVEADTMAAWWRDHHDLTAALAVAKTEFWRLPAPDERRIDRDDLNITRYSFGRSWTVKVGHGFLVDAEGTIVAVEPLMDTMNASRLYAIIEILLTRQVANR